MDFNIGDEVITIKGLWHNGQNVGDRLAKVISVTGHIIIEIYEYESNPVKCFRYEIEKRKQRPKGHIATYKNSYDRDDEVEIDLDFDDPDPIF